MVEKIKFSAGHADLLNEHFGIPIGQDVEPSELAKLAKDNNKVEELMHILQQEIVNTLVPIQDLTDFSSAIEQEASQVSEKNIDKLERWMIAYAEAIFMATDNVTLLAECFSLIIQSTAQEPELLSEKASGYAASIAKHLKSVYDLMADKKEHYNDIYQSAEAKVKQFKENN